MSTAPSVVVWGDFEVHFDRPLGRGGMGAVYRARQRSLDRWVAVKVLDPGRGDPMLREGFLEKFRVEALALARLNDPRIVHVYQAGEDGPRRWFAMELVEGSSLEARLEQSPPLTEREARRIAAEVARGLEAAHRCGIVHRDVKPGNVFLRPDGAVKIGDFGLARSPSLESTKLTDVGALACTPAYASPEQLDGDETDHRSDLYSLGAVLYEMAAQRPPFLSERLVPGGKPPPLRSLRPEFSMAYEDLVARCLAEKPDDRWQTYADLIRALDRDPARAGVTTFPESSRTASPGFRSPLRAWALPALLGLAAFAGILVSVFAEAGRPLPPAAPPAEPPSAAPAAILAPPAAAEPVLAKPRPEPPSLRDLELLRATLPERRRFRFASSLERLGPGPDRERLERAVRAFPSGVPLRAGDPATLLLRDGRRFAGRVEEAGPESVRVDGTLVPLDAIDPDSFPAARDPLVRSACGGALGALPELGRIDPRFQAGLIDGAVEEALRDADDGDFRGLRAFRLSRERRGEVDPFLGSRLRLLEDERRALDLLEKKELARLLLERPESAVGRRAASDRLARWSAELPADPDLELVGEVAWGGWRPDLAHAPGGSASWVPASRTYALSARRPEDRLWLLKPLEGARRGWEVRFRRSPAGSAAFAAALSFTRWIEVGPASTRLMRVDAERVSVARSVDRVGSRLTVIPEEGATLVYVDGTLAFALEPADGALEGGLQLGAGGGTVDLESIRVADRTR